MADNEKTPRPLFGQIAVMAEFCTQDQVNECLKIQNKGKKAGTHFYIGSIMLNKGYITLPQALQILKYQKVQIVQDPSNNNRYNVHEYSNNKKYRSPESKELLASPPNILTITVRGDMGLKKVAQEAAEGSSVPGTLHDIDSTTYDMSADGSAIDVTSLNLEVDSPVESAQPVAFDDIGSQTEDAEMIDPFGGSDFSDDLFGQSAEEFQDAEPFFAEEEDAFGTIEDDPFASSVDMFNDAEAEAEKEKTSMQDKFPKQMNSSFYVGADGSGTHEVEARQGDDEWGEWEDSGESDEPKADEQQIDRTLDGPVMAKLSSEERALSDDFDLVDGATMMDSDAGVAMGAELRDLMKRENLDFSEQGATTFEDAVAAFDTEASDDESLEADEEDFADDPFAQVSGGEFGSTFDEDLTGDFFDTQVDEGDAETIQDEPFDSMINEDWDVPDISEDEEKSKDFEEEISEEISGAQFWDTVPEGEESEIEQPGVTDDVFAQQLPGDTDDTGQDAAVGAGITDFDQFEKFADSISEDASSDEEGMQTVEMFTSEGELDEAARDELMLDSIDSMQSNIDAEVEFSSEMMEEAEGALGGDIAQAEGALGGDIAQAEGELEGDVLELESESASAYLVSESPRAVDPIARQIKKKRKRDIDYVEEFALDEITKLDQEKDEYVVREEKTDVDIQYVREEKTDLDIKRPSGWRSLFYGRRATDAKAKVNWVFFIFFLIGLSIIACGVAMLTDFIYTNGEMFDQISAYFSKNFELDNADMPDEVWNDYVFARDLTRNYEFQRALESFNHSVRQYPAYKTLFQSERTAMIKLQNEVDDLIGIEYNAAIERTRDEKGLRAALSNTEKFIEKYSQKPYSNLSKSADYIKNAQDEIVRIKSELEEELIPKEPELIDRLKKVCAWAPVELLDNTEEFETEFQKYNAILKEMSSKIMPFWKNKDVELFKRVYVRYIAVSRFFEKEVILCELLMKESETSDFDIKSIWHAISEVKSAEEAVRKYNEFDSVLETDWILENKHRINNEYVDKVYGSLQMAYDQAKGLTTAEYKTKIDLLKKLLEDIELAKELELKEEIREAINEMESDINSMLTDLIRYSNYTDWRNEALTNLKNGDIDVALEYFNKIYPFTEDVNKDEIKAAYNKCQFLVLKRDAPAAFNKALMYNANLTEYTKEELMQIWEKSYDLYTKLYGLLFDAEGNLFDYVYDDNKQDGFEVVNDCVEYKLISESLKHLWTAQYQFEIGMNDRNYEIFKTAKGNYNKALPYFMSHYDWYQKQANEIKILIAKCDFEPLKLESIAVREQAVELMELKNREKAEEALRLTEYSDELWNDALVIEQNNDLRAIHAKDVQELVKIANLIDEIKRAIRRHLYEEKLDEAVIYEQNEDFNRAITVLENAKIYTTDLRWLKKYINILTVKDLMKKAKALAIKEPAEYDEALKLLNEAAKIDPLESEIYVLKNRYTYLQKKSELKKKNAAEMSLIASGTALLHDGKQVEFKDYYIDKNEVTNAEYAKFLKFLESIDNNDDLFRHPKQPTDVTGITGLGVRSHVPKCWGFPGYNDPNQPVVGVTYWDAYAYAKWAGKRLPYVSEWEYAAAGNARRVYPWSSEALIDNAFCAELAKKMQKTYPMLVNSLIAGAVVGTEIMHMIGNVREWTALDAEGSETAVVKGGSFKTPLSQTTNGSEEILKLGSWDDATGFRCVMDK